MNAKTSKNAYRQLTQMLNNSLQTLQPETDEPEVQQSPKLEITPQTMQKFEALLQLEKITKPDLEVLTPEEKQTFTRYLSQLFTEKKDRQLDVLVEKIEGIVSPDVNDDIRESNRVKINNAIAKSLQQNGQMPGKAEIARATGLSRNTVMKHMQEFNGTVTFKEYLYAKTNVMESVIKAAVNGDMRAAKLYMGTVTKLPGQQNNTTIVNQQNNYIQMNGVKVNFKQLPADELAQIEQIISRVLVVKEE